MRLFFYMKWVAVSALVCVLASCGGGGGGSNNSPSGGNWDQMNWDQENWN